jgi:hypothetical protein
MMLLICYPAMRYLSEGYSLNDLFFSVFAGLRGSVSLALCIVIQTHIDSDNGDSAGVGYVSFPKDEIRQVENCQELLHNPPNSLYLSPFLPCDLFLSILSQLSSLTSPSPLSSPLLSCPVFSSPLFSSLRLYLSYALWWLSRYS